MKVGYKLLEMEILNHRELMTDQQLGDNIFNFIAGAVIGQPEFSINHYKLIDEDRIGEIEPFIRQIPEMSKFISCITRDLNDYCADDAEAKLSRLRRYYDICNSTGSDTGI